MFKRAMFRGLTLFAVLVFAIGAFAQPAAPTVKFAMATNDIEPLPGGEVVLMPVDSNAKTWEIAQAAGVSWKRLFVVSIDQPDRRQSCHIQSFTAEKLMCSRALGAPRTYLRQQVLALILPGDGGLKTRLLLGLNGAAGAAVWGTVVLAAACPACAVTTGIAALLILSAAGAIGFGDDQPERLLYLAPGQELSRKLGYVER